MSPKKTPRGTPKISYRDLMAVKGAPEKVEPAGPDTPKPDAIPIETAKAETTRAETAKATYARSAEESQHLSSAASATTSAASASKKPEIADVPNQQGAKDLPPARRRDRSRELTPRELAAVLNEEQAAAAREKAEKAALEAEAEHASEADAGQPVMPPAAINAAIIEDEGQRRSAGISTDTMEFAVAAATATLPFRDRVRARAGLVEVLRFRIGTELFATDLSAAEEVLERPAVHRVPEMPDQMLGVFSLRGKLIPVFSPTRVLGASLAGEFGAAIVLRAADRRIALAIDDVDDVMTLDLAKLREIPSNSDPEGILLAVAWHGSELVSLVDAEALLAACQSEQLAETV